jgi:PadR family transcriptional regulator, regulatory protein PadR
MHCMGVDRDSLLLRGVLDLCLLALLKDRPVYGYEVARQLKARGLDIGAGSVYPLLARLERAGDVRSQEKSSPTGPPRKYWVLTPTGRRTLDAGRVSWQRVSGAVTAIISDSQTAKAATS